MDAKQKRKNSGFSPLFAVIVIKNYFPLENIPNTLHLMEDDIVYVLDNSNPHWWDGILVDPVGNITRGWFPVCNTKIYKAKSSFKSNSQLINSSLMNNPANLINNKNDDDDYNVNLDTNVNYNDDYDDNSSSNYNDNDNDNYVFENEKEKSKSNEMEDNTIDDKDKDKDKNKDKDKDKYKDKDNLIIDTPEEVQKSIFGKLDKDLEKSPLTPQSFLSHGKYHQNRRQSLIPRHQSYSSGHRHQLHHPNKQHVLPKSCHNDNYNFIHQNSSSTSKNDLPTSSTNSLFKEKNYFATKHDSITSSNSQLPHDSRQSSQAFTDGTASSFQNSVCLVSNEEVVSYFQPSNPQSQPAFNFIPIWIPQFGQNYEVIYKNQALNVYTQEIPFIEGDYINEKSLYETPDTNNLIQDLNQLPISLRRQNSDTSSINLNMNHKFSSYNILKSGSSNQDNNILPSNLKNLPPQLQSLYNMPSFINSRPTEIFYTEATDFLTWDALVSGFINSIDKCIASLKDYDKLNFKNSLNDASDIIAFYHTAGRLILKELLDSNKLSKFSAILKKITNMFIKFRIWSTLAVVSIDRFESFKLSKDFNFKTTEVNLSSINNYIEETVYYRSKLDKLSSHLIILISKVSIYNSNNDFKKNNLNVLPMIYPRFIRGKFEGGNFKNKFVNNKSTQNDFFIDPNRNRINVLLDENLLEKLKSIQSKVYASLGEVQNILELKLPTNTSLKVFLDDRNLKLLTAVYQLIPLLSSFINLFESIDLTVFAMIDKLAVNPIEQERQNTISNQNKNQDENENANENENSNQAQNQNTKQFNINKNDLLKENRFNSPSISDDGYTDLTDDTENNYQSFYDATAKVFRPLIQDYIHMKQSVHSVFSDLILDAQIITVEDPETFFSMKREKSKNLRHSKIKLISDIMIQKLEQIDAELYNDGIYALEPSLKLLETIKLSKERIKLISIMISQLNDERRSILNYCSRLMNSDFNIASLFIAERHNTLVSKISQGTQSGKSTSTANSNDKLNDNFDNEEQILTEDFLLNNSNLPDAYYYTSTVGNLNYPNVPWYMNTDHDEENLIYEATSLKGGTTRGLIAKLVNPLNPYDELFEETFLCFFSTFVKPLKLFEILIEKYHLNMPEALDYEEYSIWLEQKLKPQQRKILYIFETLFSKYWIVSYTSPELIIVWENFINNTPLIDESLINLSNQVLLFEKQEEYIKYFGLANRESKTIPVSPLTSQIIHLKIQSLNINYVAQQITAVQAFYYRKINLWDLLGRSYNFSRILHKRTDRNNNKDPLGTKNISVFIKNCNNLTHYTTFMILRNKDLKERIESIKYFITLAEQLLHLKNFSSMTAIVSGLASTSVSRLRKTWNGVPKKYISKFQKMDNLMSIGKNYSEYRNILKFVETDGDAYLPFLGMYLSDLRFTTDGNPDWLTSKKGSNGLVNYSKRMSIMKIIREVMNFNKTLYQIKLDPDFSRYLTEMFTELPDDEKMYELSITIEPRVSLLKNSKSTTTIGAGPLGSISAVNATSLSSIFGGYNAYGSFSTVSSSHSGENAIIPASVSLSNSSTNNLSGNGNSNLSTGSAVSKKPESRRPQRYRPLLSLTAADKDKDNDKDKEREKEREKEKGKEKERFNERDCNEDINEDYNKTNNNINNNDDANIDNDDNDDNTNVDNGVVHDNQG